MNIINNEIFETFFDCQYKSYKKANNFKGEKTDLEKLDILELKLLKKSVLKQLKNPYDNKYETVTFEMLKTGHNWISNAKISEDNVEFLCDLLEKVSINSKLGNFSYSPVVISNNQKNIAFKYKILISGYCAIINRIQGINNKYGKIISGQDSKTIKVDYSKYLSKYNEAIAKIKLNEKPILYLNSHCSSCEFSKKCRQQALKDDNLSLLNGIPKEKIRKLNSKGIFTVNQLSYTFRPKRKTTKRKQIKASQKLFELQALSLREKKIHVINKPQLPGSETEMFFDMEGLPEVNFNYLIGLIIVSDGQTNSYSLWIDTIENEKSMVKDFIEVINNYNPCTIYHYGDYEIKYLKYIKKKFPETEVEIDKIIASCFNILSLLYSDIYFPTFSNSLKEIGNFIEFHWTDDKASGLQSIFWRKKWEANRKDLFKQKIIKYNQEDCQALLLLKQKIILIINKEIAKTDGNNLNVIHTDDIKPRENYNFLVNECAFPEMNFINKCSYFDYQRDKVNARKNLILKKAIKKKRIQKESFYNLTTNKIIDLDEGLCPSCGSSKVQIVKVLSRKIADLKFSKTGVKRAILEFRSGKFKCKKCNTIFIPNLYKNIKLRVGHNFIVWTIYQHIVNKMSFRSVEDTLLELYNLYISRATLFACKRYFVDFYQATYDELVGKVLNGKFIYADETPFAMQFEKGYSWIFTNNEEVILFYKNNREGTFLKDFLKDFKGVLISDFYAVYDSIPCSQQRCLIHLIRDLNSDLIKNPFNEEFKIIASDFTTLLQKIVLTIDKYGLKKYFLNKHKKGADAFINSISKQTFKSEIAKSYQKRFIKNSNRLFEFLNHDNISWNNSSAEHAIKILALHANKNMNTFRASKIDEYLKIISIYITCEYKNISFLKFLLSKEKSIDMYCKKLFNIR